MSRETAKAAHPNHRRVAERGLIVRHDIKIYIANGWQLADEPDCSGARMLPQAAVFAKIPSVSPHVALVTPCEHVGGGDG